MKKVLAVFVFLSFSPFLLVSQNSANLIGLQYGFTQNPMYNLGESAELVNQSGWSRGINYEKFVSDTWSLNIEFNRTNSKAEIKNYMETRGGVGGIIVYTSAGDVDLDIRYSQFVFMIKKYIGKRNRFFLDLGWNIKQVYENLGTWDYTLIRYYNDNNLWNPVKLDMPEVTMVQSQYVGQQRRFGVNLGVGTKIDLPKHFKLVMKGRYNHEVEMSGIKLSNLEVLCGIQYEIPPGEVKYLLSKFQW